MIPRSRTIRLAFTLALALVPTAVAATPASAEDAVAVTSFGPQRVVSFDTATPGTFTNSQAVAGLQRRELVLSIDFRPRTRQIVATTSKQRLLALDPQTGQSTVLDPSMPELGFGDAWAGDFNPAVDRLRHVTGLDDRNIRIDVDGNAATTDTPVTYKPGDRNAGRNPEVSAEAYTNNVDGATETLLYGIDTDLNTLVVQDPPNDGALSTIGPIGVNTLGEAGFDISGETGTAFAILTPSSPRRSNLYRVNLETGAATLVGPVGPFGRYRGLTIVPPDAGPAREVDVLFNNDPESKILPIGSGPAAGYAGASQHFTLFGSLAAEVSRPISPATLQRSVLRLNAGDNTIPSLEFRASLEKSPRVPFYDTTVLDRLNFDALAIGNHEFDSGPRIFRQFVSGFSEGATFVAANLDASQEPETDQFVGEEIVPSVTVEKDGDRFGIIGSSPDDLENISSPGAVTTSDPLVPVQEEIDDLEEQGVDKIFLVTQNQSINNDIQLARRLDGIDVIVSGGGQETQADADTPLVPGDTRSAGFDFPLTTSDVAGSPVKIATTNGLYKYVGRVSVRFSPSGRVIGHVEADSKPYRVSPDIAEDSFLEEEVLNPIRESVAALTAQVIASTEITLNRDSGSYVAPPGAVPTGFEARPGGTFNNGIRTSERPFGDLVADAQLFGARRAATAAGDPLPTLSLQNAGGIRSNIPAGNINRRQTFDALPFNNAVAVVDVTPAQLKAALENGVSRVRLADGRFPQISGFRFTYDVNRPQGDRVRLVELDDGTDLVVDGAVVGGAPSQRLALNDFVARGSDGYSVFASLPNTRYSVTYLEALEQFLQTPVADGGLAREGDDVTAAEYPGTGRSTRLEGPTP